MGLRAQENFRVRDVRTPMAQVIQQAFADVLSQRVDEFFSSFVGRKSDPTLSPMDVRKLLGTHLSAAHRMCICVQHLDDGKVAPP